MVRKLLPQAWALLLGLLLLGPALGPGYLLTYDLVWVPALDLRPDFWGAGTALPRAVPSDAVVAVLDTVVPGKLLQVVVLLGALVLAGVGAQRLVGGSVLARGVAVSVYVWNPFVVERLLIGHWPVLLGYAALPWLLVEGGRYRRSGRATPLLLLLLPLGSLSANAGLMTALAVLAVGLPLGRGLLRRGALLAPLLAAANAPWVVAGLLHLDTATSTGAGSVFGLGDEAGLPGPVAALTLGGIWNAETVPASRTVLVLVLVATVAVLATAVLGGPRLADRLGRRTAGALVGLWAVGYGLAVLTWAAPGAVSWSAAHVPGGGLLRDGARWLALCAPLVAVLVALGAERAAGHWRDRQAWTLVGIGAVLLPLALLPDAAWGVGGRLDPATYPDDYAAARSAMVASREAGEVRGDTLLLPFTSYRAPDWNHGRKVLDPVGRYLPGDVLASDQLGVSGQVLAGEDPRVGSVLAALALPDPDDRATALGRLGVGAVVRDLAAPTSPTYDAPVAGTVLFAGSDLELLRIDAPVDVDRLDTGRRIALWLAWLGFVGVTLAGGVVAARGGMLGKAGRPPVR